MDDQFGDLFEDSPPWGSSLLLTGDGSNDDDSPVEKDQIVGEIFDLSFLDEIDMSLKIFKDILPAPVEVKKPASPKKAPNRVKKRKRDADAPTKTPHVVKNPTNRSRKNRREQRRRKIMKSHFIELQTLVGDEKKLSKKRLLDAAIDYFKELIIKQKVLEKENTQLKAKLAEVGM